ncbi:hypothetical protein [Adlercreutzia muris]|uniref:hypothetical protein n=1 Tax=Adlercreutzia muris TaxID=1796610 RepID=UPI003513F679
MITTHALTILVGALAFAFVLIGAGVVYLQRHIDEGLAKVNKRLDTLEPGHSASAETGDAAVAVGTLKAAR